MKEDPDTMRGMLENMSEEAGQMMRQEELQRVAKELSARPLPQPRGTWLQVLPVDPSTLYAYWHIDRRDWHEGRDSLSANADQAVLALKFRDSTGAAAFDVVLEGRCGKRYITLWRSGRDYRVELGFVGKRAFQVLAACENVSTPGVESTPEEERFQLAPVLEATPSVAAREPASARFEEAALEKLAPRAEEEEVADFPLSMRRAPIRDALSFLDLTGDTPSEISAPTASEGNETASLYKPPANAPSANFPQIDASQLTLYSRNTRRFRQDANRVDELPPLPGTFQTSAIVNNIQPIPTPSGNIAAASHRAAGKERACFSARLASFSSRSDGSATWSHRRILR